MLSEIYGISTQRSPRKFENADLAAEKSTRTTADDVSQSILIIVAREFRTDSQNVDNSGPSADREAGYSVAGIGTVGRGYHSMESWGCLGRVSMCGQGERVNFGIDGPRGCRGVCLVTLQTEIAIDEN